MTDLVAYRPGGIVPTDLPKRVIFIWRRAHDEVRKEIEAAGRPTLPFSIDGPWIDTEAIWGVSYDELKDMEQESRKLWESYGWWARHLHRREFEEARWLAALAAQRVAACLGLEVVWR